MTHQFLTPRGLCRGALAAVAPDTAWTLCDNRLGFTAVERTMVQANGKCETQLFTRTSAPPDLHQHLTAFATLRGNFAGLDMSRPRIMGIVNVTPDSFSDGGDHASPAAAIAHGRRLLDEGADILDVGGESTRPGADPVDPSVEIDRVVPVIEALAGQGALVSIDTRHAQTMAVAIKAGARIVNDVTALSDAAARDIVVRTGVSVVLMHMRGEPRTMQSDPRYVWAPGDIFTYLTQRVADCERAGVQRHRIAIDPGIGFGQNDSHIVQVFDHLAMFHALGCPVVVGASRKAFIKRWAAAGAAQPKQRVAGSLVAAIDAIGKGVQIVRVHDVAETRQAISIYERLQAIAPAQP